MQQLHQGGFSSDALPGPNILPFPRRAEQAGSVNPDPVERAQAAPAAEEAAIRTRIPGFALGLLVLPATMLLVEVVRRLIEGG
jgi:hypothetical protein